MLAVLGGAGASGGENRDTAKRSISVRPREEPAASCPMLYFLDHPTRVGGSETYAELAGADLSVSDPADRRCQQQHDNGNDDATSRRYHLVVVLCMYVTYLSGDHSFCDRVCVVWLARGNEAVARRARRRCWSTAVANACASICVADFVQRAQSLYSLHKADYSSKRGFVEWQDGKKERSLGEEERWPSKV